MLNILFLWLNNVLQMQNTVLKVLVTKTSIHVHVHVSCVLCKMIQIDIKFLRTQFISFKCHAIKIGKISFNVRAYTITVRSWLKNKEKSIPTLHVNAFLRQDLCNGCTDLQLGRRFKNIILVLLKHKLCHLQTIHHIAFHIIFLIL